MRSAGRVVPVPGAKVVTPDEAVEIARTGLETPIEGERHQRRLDKLAARNAHLPTRPLCVILLGPD